MISRIKLWIIFSLFGLDYCNRDLTEKVEELAKKFTSEFEKINKALSETKITSDEDTKLTKLTLNDAEIKELLRTSKSETEKLITKANEVVNNLQEKLTKAFSDYSQSPAKKYKLECVTNESFIFYYRAKALKDRYPSELKTCGQQFLPLEKDPFLGNVLTNREEATAHVPTNVYDASTEIQNVANWTANLHEIFKEQKNDSQLKWQFFCSNTGLFKIYPGIRWSLQIEDSEKDNTLVDFFDCRSEQWYLEATSYPKKMMIMVDKSGSMKGRRRIIANHTIYEILNTLTENDFFNILLLGRKFTKEYFFADNATSGILMQATDKNKKYILDQLGTVFNPDGIAEYDFGLNESFKVLRKDKFNDSNSIYYSYLLMIITDGSPMDYQLLIEYHNKDIGARIFTYLIGQGTTEREMVTNMACKNQGYAVEIATLADVKENVQKYLNVVARKNALMRNTFNVWTGVHNNQMQPTEDTPPSNFSDATFMPPILNPSSTGVTFAPNITSPFPTTTATTTSFPSNGSIPVTPTQSTTIEILEDKPINLFVTASKAIFDETNFTAEKNLGVLLGAAGVDVPINEFIKTAPFWKIGVNAYLFGVTSNGFVLFHPKYAPQYKKHVKYFYRNVDISELEIESNSNDNMTFIRNDQIVQTNGVFQLRKEMLSEIPGIKDAGTLTTYQLVDDFKTAFSVTRKYYITEISKTSYKFGLAVPVNQEVPFYSEKEFVLLDKSKFVDLFQENFENLNNNCKIIFTQKNESGMTMKNHEFCHMNRFIASLQMNGPLCVLFEVMTNDSSLKDCVKDDPLKKNYINNIYYEMKYSASFPINWKEKVFDSSNIQQIFSMHHFGLIRYYNYETLSYQHFIANHSLGIEDPLYQQTILVSQHLNNNKVLVARPLPNEVVKKNIAQSALVFTVTKPLVENGIYIGILGVQAKYNNFLSIFNNSICDNSERTECFVITESSLILLNNQDIRHNGDLLNEIDCALMESLVKNKVFIEQSVYDFQALCPNQSKQADSFSARLLNPFSKFFRFAMWLIYELLITIQHFSLSNLIWSIKAQDESISSVDESRQVFPTEVSIQKPIANIIQSAGGSFKKNTQTESKSKRQHELDVKGNLNSEFQLCNKNHRSNENELSGCIQKAVSTICRSDKNHITPPSDQHVEKVTPLNKISHCEAACNILRSDYPKVWQEQDDCKLPQKLCHKFMPTFTSIFPASLLKNATPPEPLYSPPSQPDNVDYQPQDDYQANSYRRKRNNILQNSQSSNDAKSDSPLFRTSGKLCVGLCPTKTWYVKEISGTNLLLVVVDKQNNACSCDCKNGFGKPKELKRIVNQSIENPYILKPNFFLEFVNFTKVENSSACYDDAIKTCMSQRFIIALSVFYQYLWHFNN